MLIVLTGGTGFIGQALGKKLVERGYSIRLIARSPPKSPLPYPFELFLWPDSSQNFPLKAFPQKEPFGLIHLAGEPVYQWPWNKALKKRIRSSRVESSRQIIAALNSSPSFSCKFFLSAGALGIYGWREEWISESSPMSQDQGLFLQSVCRDWEAEVLKAKSMCRTSIFRMGMVLSKEGGFLQEQIKWLRRGVRPLPSSKYWLSWIALEDLVSLFLWGVENQNCSGIYHAVSPEATPLSEFYSLLSEGLKQGNRGGSFFGSGIPVLPPVLPLPLFLIRRLGGEMTKNLLLSCRACPKRALSEGFVFKKANLKEVLFEASMEKSSSEAANSSKSKIFTNQ